MKLTIGVPVFNAERYIERCLNSVVGIQGVEDYEVICVDDGSTDGTCDILRRYEKKYRKIRVIYTKNNGAFIARSRVIDEARGEWIGFVDADDTVNSKMYKKMLERAEEQKNVDMVVCAFNKINSRDGSIKSTHMNNYGNSIFDFIVNEHDRGILATVNPAYWNKIFRSCRLMNRIRLDYSPKIMEDYIFFASVVTELKGVAFVSEALYNYYDTSDSVTKYIGKKELDEAKKALLILDKWFDEQKAILKNVDRELIALMSCIHLGIAFTINWSDFSSLKISDVYRNTRRFIDYLFPYWWKNKYLKMTYLFEHFELKKVYLACFLFRTRFWTDLVYIYKFLCRFFSSDFKW